MNTLQHYGKLIACGKYFATFALFVVLNQGVDAQNLPCPDTNPKKENIEKPTNDNILDKIIKEKSPIRKVPMIMPSFKPSSDFDDGGRKNEIIVILAKPREDRDRMSRSIQQKELIDSDQKTDVHKQSDIQQLWNMVYRTDLFHRDLWYSIFMDSKAGHEKIDQMVALYKNMSHETITITHEEEKEISLDVIREGNYINLYDVGGAWLVSVELAPCHVGSRDIIKLFFYTPEGVIIYTKK